MSWQALNWCAALHHVKGSRRALLWAMANRHNTKTGLITMGLSSIADESGVSRSFAHRQLKRLEREGLICALIPGSGTRPTAYVIPALASPLKGTQAPVDNRVVERSSVPEVTGSSDLASPLENLASPLGGTPIRIARAPKGNQEENQRAGGAAADAAAPRSNGQVPAEAREAIAALKASSRRVPTVPVSQPSPLSPLSPVSPPATAQQPQPREPTPATENALPRPAVQADTARELDPAQATRRRRHDQRGRKGRRGREPPRWHCPVPSHPRSRDGPPQASPPKVPPRRLSALQAAEAASQQARLQGKGHPPRVRR